MRYIWLLLLCVGCASGPPVQSDLQAVTAVPSLAEASVELLCETIQSSSESDLLLHIEALLILDGRGATCADIQDTGAALYNAHTSHAEQLLEAGRTREAESYYLRALTYTETDSRAREALQRLGNNAVQNAPLDTCDDDTVRMARDNTPAYVPQQVSRVILLDNQLTLDGQPFTVRSVQYEPRDAPGRRFLSEVTTAAIETELVLIAEAGFNTVRINLIYDVLFQCPGNGAVPVPEAFARLDTVLEVAINREMRVVLVLHHAPDLTDFPLYSSPGHTLAQTVFITQRYADAPGIMVWDLRDSGDRDYTGGAFEREAVIAWLTQTAQVVRQNAPQQLMTAGWREDSVATAPFVDFVSLQHYGTVDDLRQQIALLRTQTDKPLFLTGVGYPTTSGDEPGQRDRLFDALLAAENNRLLGWNIVEAFDHPATVCENCERFGLWNTSYFPKLALDAAQTVINQE